MPNNFALLKIINPFLILSFVVQFMTAVLLFFDVSVFGAHLFDVHQYNGLLMITLVFIHFTLNSGWVKSVYFKRKIIATPSSPAQ